MLENLLNNYFVQNVFYTVFVITLSISVINYWKIRNLVLKEKLHFKNIDFPFIIQMIILIIVLRIAFEQVQTHFNIRQTNETIDISISSMTVFFLTRCVVAPVAEEIIFRFGLFEYIMRKYHCLLSTILSSLIFSILHGYVIFDTFNLMIMSILCCYSYHKKNNLVYPILLHYTYNFYAFIGYIITSNLLK